jgi:hypothetical protein
MRSLLPLLAVLLAACGTEVGRVPLAGPGSGTAKVTLKAGEVAFWTDLDVEWDGSLGARYDVTLTSGGQTLTASCNPTDVTARLNSVRNTTGSKSAFRYEGKMKCDVTAPEGDAVLTATLSVGNATAMFKKSDLVVKQ